MCLLLSSLWDDDSPQHPIASLGIPLMLLFRVSLADWGVYVWLSSSHAAGGGALLRTMVRRGAARAVPADALVRWIFHGGRAAPAEYSAGPATVRPTISRIACIDSGVGWLHPPKHRVARRSARPSAPSYVLVRSCALLNA